LIHKTPLSTAKPHAHDCGILYLEKIVNVLECVLINEIYSNVEGHL